jgi:hypothetical protein
MTATFDQKPKTGLFADLQVGLASLTTTHKD